MKWLNIVGIMISLMFCKTVLGDLVDDTGNFSSVTVNTIPDLIDDDPAAVTHHRMIYYYNHTPVSPNGRWVIYTRVPDGLKNQYDTYTVKKEVIVREVSPVDPENPIQHTIRPSDPDYNWERHQMNRTMWVSNSRIVFWRYKKNDSVVNRVLVYDNTQADGSGSWNWARESGNNCIPEDLNGNKVLCVNSLTKSAITSLVEYDSSDDSSQTVITTASLAAMNSDPNSPVYGFSTDQDYSAWYLGHHPKYSEYGKYILFSVIASDGNTTFLYDRQNSTFRIFDTEGTLSHTLFQGDDSYVGVVTDDGYSITVFNVDNPVNKYYWADPCSYNYPSDRYHHAPNHNTMLSKHGIIISDAQYSVLGDNKYIRMYYKRNPGDDPVQIHLTDYYNSTSNDQDAHPAFDVSGVDEEYIRVFFNYDDVAGPENGYEQCKVAYIDLRKEFAAGYWSLKNRGWGSVAQCNSSSAGADVLVASDANNTDRKFQFEIVGYDGANKVYRIRHHLSQKYLGVSSIANNAKVKLIDFYDSSDSKMQWLITPLTGDDEGYYRISLYGNSNYHMCINTVDGVPSVVIRPGDEYYNSRKWEMIIKPYDD